MPQAGDAVLHYELLSELGKGGMGQVFKALDTRLRREVALKFLLTGSNPDFKDRLLHEARSIARLDHLNIGVLHTVEEHEGDLFLVMALYEGEDLASRLEREPLEADETLSLFAQLLAGLVYAHDRGIVHRDLKPENIFISTEGLVKILDFGLAKTQESDLTRTGQYLGTPRYSSPEHLEGADIDARSDIWSLGVLLFHCLTNAYPFDGSTPRILSSILHGEPVLDALQHQALRSIVSKCLQRDTAERFQSCLELAQALSVVRDTMRDLEARQLVTLGEITLLGSQFSRQKPLLLLAYLAVEGAKDRRFLAELFWMDARNPRSSLRTALSQLHSAAPEALGLSKDSVWCTLACDAKILLDAFDQADYKKVTDLHEGTFLEGLDIDLGVELEEWLYSTRELITRRVQLAWLKQAESEARDKQFKQAAQCVLAALALGEALEADELKQAHSLLVAAEHPKAGDIKAELAGYGLALHGTAEEARVSLEASLGVSDSQSEALRSRRLPRLVGREVELGELIQLLTDEDNYLITIAGLGGSGKTSLARAVLAELSSDVFPDGVHFVAFEALTDATQMPYEIASSLGLQLQGQDSWVALTRNLQGKSLVLCLDNLEHLIQDCAVELEALLSDCPSLTILATSREVLNVVGEVVFDLKGLALPPSVEADFDAYGATALFMRHAKRFKRSFDLEAGKEYVLSICQLLEGWPLGIELAVAWVRQLSVKEIAERISQSLDLLTSRSRTQASRHQSARAAFEYSWNLLSETEQAALAKLSVFKAGFTSEAAEIVTHTGLPSLASLMDKFLLTITPDGRYDMHPLVNQFSTEKLQYGYDVKALSLRYAEYFHDLAVAFRTDFDVNFLQTSYLQYLSSEHENLLASLGIYQEFEAERGLEMVVALDRYWEIKHYYQLGVNQLERLYATSAAIDERLHAGVCYLLGKLNLRLNRFETAQSWLTRGLSFAKQSDDQLLISRNLQVMGMVRTSQGLLGEAQALLEESLSIVEQQDDEMEKAWVLEIEKAWVLGSLANVFIAQDQVSEARMLLEKSLSIHRKTGDEVGIAVSLWALGDLARNQTEYLKAEKYYSEGLEISRRLRFQDGISLLLHGLGMVAALQGHDAKARTCLEESLALYRERGLTKEVALVLRSLGCIALNQAQEQDARMNFQQSLQLSLKQNEEKELSDLLRDIAIMFMQVGNHQISVTLFAALASTNQAGLSLIKQSLKEQSQTKLEQLKSSEDSMKLWEAGQALSLSEAAELAFAELNTTT